MERTYGKRTGSGSRKRKKAELAPQERRLLLQLAVSVGLFLLVFAGRGIFPGRTDQWKQVLGRDTDFKSAFSSFGAAISRGEPVLDTLGELCTQVFAAGTARPEAREPDWAPSFDQRMREQLTQPQDPVGRWSRRRRAAVQAAEPEPELSGAQAVTLQAVLEAPEGTVLAAQRAVAVEERVITATPQRYTADGQQLPDSVSMAYYYLGLDKTVTPVSAVLTSDYGYRDHPVSGIYRFHWGVDLGAPLGTEIAAFADGTVSYTGRNDTCGLYLQIAHDNGVTTFYCHCSRIDVLDGQRVTAGQTVARVGATGNATGAHLHFALRKDGVYLDPLYYIEVN